MKRAFCILMLLVFSIVGHSAAQAVDSQQITGVVSDPTGAVVPNAEITVTNEATGISVTLRTNESGNYDALNLPVGTYTITAAAQGFKKTVV